MIFPFVLVTWQNKRDKDEKFKIERASNVIVLSKVHEKSHHTGRAYKNRSYHLWLFILFPFFSFQNDDDFINSLAKYQFKDFI